MAKQSWWDRLRGIVPVEGAVMEEPIEYDVQTQERDAREMEQHNAEARADRTLKFAANELALLEREVYERERRLQSGGKYRVKRKQL